MRQSASKVRQIVVNDINVLGMVGTPWYMRDACLGIAVSEVYQVYHFLRNGTFGTS